MAWNKNQLLFLLSLWVSYMVLLRQAGHTLLWSSVDQQGAYWSRKTSSSTAQPSSCLLSGHHISFSFDVGQEHHVILTGIPVLFPILKGVYLKFKLEVQCLSLVLVYTMCQVKEFPSIPFCLFWYYTCKYGVLSDAFLAFFGKSWFFSFINVVS